MVGKLSDRRATLEVVYGVKIDSDGSSSYFRNMSDDTPPVFVDQPAGTQATLSMVLSPTTAKRFLLESIRFYMNCTNVVTYTLYLLERSSSDSVTSVSDIVFDSGAGKADDVFYIVSRGDKLPHVVTLDEAGTIYYMLDWTGDPGLTSGYIIIRGRNYY